MNKLKSDKYQQELAQLFEKVTFTEKQKKGFLEMLIYAIDFRSQQTVMHTMSTKTFAVELGRLMRVSASDLQILYYGSLMHDIGKIVIPLSILEAPRRLTDEEMRIMKAHVVISDKILRGIFDDRIVNVAAKHHEKLDGSGYPVGLKDQDITLLERIAAVADILSALYGKRSYKDSFSPEKVKSILQEDADNGKICSKVVQVAINNFDTIISNYEKQRSSTMERYMEILQQYDSIYERFKEFE
jgi:putative nucleotidyltransferase with HDIG domain